MSKFFKKIFQKTGLYTPLLALKRRFDKRNYNKQEKINASRRLSFYGSFLKRGDLVFDVGANVGNRVEAFLDLSCKVIAVEPQPECQEILKQKFGNTIIIEPMGLGAKGGELEMHIADESTISTFSAEFIEKTKENKFKRNSWDKKIRVQITTLNDLIAKYGQPLFCKIDVEGFEAEVLKGLTCAIEKISFEFNVPEMSGNLNDCLQLINSLSPDYLFNYSLEENMQYELSSWLPFEQFLPLVNSQIFQDNDFGDIYAFIQK